MIGVSGQRKQEWLAAEKLGRAINPRQRDQTLDNFQILLPNRPQSFVTFYQEYATYKIYGAIFPPSWLRKKWRI